MQNFAKETVTSVAWNSADCKRHEKNKPLDPPASINVSNIRHFVISTRIDGVFSEQRNSEMATLLHRPIRALSFPEASTMGIFVALSVPLEPPRNSVSMSYFFEAMYGLPQNSTDFEPYKDRGNRKRRGIDRETIYRSIENKFARSGLRGRECLLRTICETSESSLHHNGVLGDVINVIFTPSTSRSENLPRDFLEAELAGRTDDCSKYYSDCPVGLYDTIGILV